MRIDNWKLVFDNTQRDPAVRLALYDLHTDPAESTDVSAQHTERVTELQRFADRMRTELGDTLTGVTGTGCRPLGHAAANVG